jgi:uncharacterized protein YjdB
MKILTLSCFLAASAIACAAPYSPHADTTTTPVSCTLRGVTVSPATRVVKVGDTLRVAASFNDCPGPQRIHEFRWSSSNPAIATVDSLGGLTTARGEGVATISAALAEDRSQKGAMLLQVVR